MEFNKIKSKIINFNKTNNLSKEDYKFQDFINFLDETTDDNIPIIINGNGIWVFSLIISKNKLTEDNTDKLFDWEIYSALYGYYRYSTGEYSLSKPCENCMPKEILEDAIPVFFQREMFSGHKFDVELNQQIAHILEVSKLNDSNNYYKLEKGDYVKVVEGENNQISIYTLNKKDLDKFLSISNSVLVRFFISSINKKDVDLELYEERIKNKDSDIYYEYYQNSELNFSIKQVKGFQIVHPEIKIKEYEEKKEFENFIIKDLETGHLMEHTCNPDNVSNMITKTNYPRDLSQAYFNKKVLDKYESDSEKYIIRDRLICCRDYWDLRYFMSDDKSQVIIYLCDLSSLPLEEQKYWRCFNENPSSSIPEHIIKNDFIGSWHDSFDPLKMLKTILKQFPKCKIDENEVDLWIEKNKGSIRSLDNIKYLRTGSKNEWEYEINKAQQIFVEGFNKKTINKIATHYNCSTGGNNSIDNLSEILNVLKIDTGQINAIINPLQELYRYRNDVNHSRNTVKYPSELPEELIEIYNNLIRRLYFSFEYLSRIIKSGKLNLKH